MKTRVTQSGAWGIAVVLGLVFFGLGLAMALRIAANETASDSIMEVDSNQDVPAMPDDKMDNQPIMESEDSGAMIEGDSTHSEKKNGVIRGNPALSHGEIYRKNTYHAKSV